MNKRHEVDQERRPPPADASRRNPPATTLSPDAFTVIDGPPSSTAPTPYRIAAPTVAREKKASFVIIAEELPPQPPSAVPSRPASPSGRVSPFRGGRGFKPSSQPSSRDPSPSRLKNATYNVKKPPIAKNNKKSRIPQISPVTSPKHSLQPLPLHGRRSSVSPSRPPVLPQQLAPGGPQPKKSSRPNSPRRHGPSSLAKSNSSSPKRVGPHQSRPPGRSPNVRRRQVVEENNNGSQSKEDLTTTTMEKPARTRGVSPSPGGVMLSPSRIPVKRGASPGYTQPAKKPQGPTGKPPLPPRTPKANPRNSKNIAQDPKQKNKTNSQDSKTNSQLKVSRGSKTNLQESKSPRGSKTNLQESKSPQSSSTNLSESKANSTQNSKVDESPTKPTGPVDSVFYATPTMASPIPPTATTTTSKPSENTSTTMSIATTTASTATPQAAGAVRSVAPSTVDRVSSSTTLTSALPPTSVVSASLPPAPAPAPEVATTASPAVIEVQPVTADASTTPLVTTTTTPAMELAQVADTSSDSLINDRGVATTAKTPSLESITSAAGATTASLASDRTSSAATVRAAPEASPAVAMPQRLVKGDPDVEVLSANNLGRPVAWDRPTPGLVATTNGVHQVPPVPVKAGCCPRLFGHLNCCKNTPACCKACTDRTPACCTRVTSWFKTLNCTCCKPISRCKGLGDKLTTCCRCKPSGCCKKKTPTDTDTETNTATDTNGNKWHCCKKLDCCPKLSSCCRRHQEGDEREASTGCCSNGKRVGCFPSCCSKKNGETGKSAGCFPAGCCAKKNVPGNPAAKPSGCFGCCSRNKGTGKSSTGCCGKKSSPGCCGPKGNGFWGSLKYCCAAMFCLHLGCCSCKCCARCRKDAEVGDAAEAMRRRSNATRMSKKKSIDPEKLKIDPSLVEYNSVMRASIPVLPVPLAWVCLFFNIFMPGIGTVSSGLFCLCFGRARFSQRDDMQGRFGAFIVDFIVGVGQLFTVLFCLVGWGWSIWWGVIMVKLARKHKRLQKDGGGQENVPAPVAVGQNHDVERGR